MKSKIFFLLLVCSLNSVFSESENLRLRQSEIHKINKNLTLKIDVHDIESSGLAGQTVIKVLKKNKSGSWEEKGSLESIKLEEGNIGEGFQFCWMEENKIYVQQSFGDGRFIIISKLIFEYNDRDEIKLTGYIENHVDRFSDEKDFSDIQFEIPDNVSFNEVNSEFVYDMHCRQ